MPHLFSNREVPFTNCEIIAMLRAHGMREDAKRMVAEHQRFMRYKRAEDLRSLR